MAAFPFTTGAGFARIPAARELLLTIPPEVTSEAVNYAVEGPELIHFRNFFEVWDGFTALHAVRGSEPDSGQKLQTVEWRKHYGVSIPCPFQWTLSAVMNRRMRNETIVNIGGLAHSCGCSGSVSQSIHFWLASAS